MASIAGSHETFSSLPESLVYHEQEGPHGHEDPQIEAHTASTSSPTVNSSGEISEQNTHHQPEPTEEQTVNGHLDSEGENTLHTNHRLVASDGVDNQLDRPLAQGFRSTESYHGPAIHQINDHRQPVDVDPTPLRRHRVLCKHICSLLDLKITIRFIVVIFHYFLGLATAYSVYVPSNLPLPRSDTYPVMVAQIVGSLLSPLLFGVVSVRESSNPLRQQVTSFYYHLLVLGVLLSVVSLLLYSLWPAGYRVNNVVTIASLMFAILGGWQSLEKDWKEAAETHQATADIELSSRSS